VANQAFSLDRDNDFPPHGSINGLRGFLGHTGLFCESRPFPDLQMHLADNALGLFRLEVTEDAELYKIGQLEMVALAVQAHLVLLSPASGL